MTKLPTPLPIKRQKIELDRIKTFYFCPKCNEEFRYPYNCIEHIKDCVEDVWKEVDENE